jgi:Fic family protein
MSATKYHADRFPPRELDWPRLLPLIGPANAAVARYEGVLHGIPNASVLLSPLSTQEAVLSSKIEGTQATFGEVLEFEASGETAKGDSSKVADIQEVLNYRAALHHAVELMSKLPLSQRVIRGAHEVLMQGVRGQNRSPGKYRRVPNWIGPPGCTLEQARYIPPGAEILPAAMSAWESYIHTPAPDLLVQLAILHAEFEAVHPFLDGNGRLGRLLVPLFLVEKKLLSSPNFYISEYLESRRDAYYERLLEVSRKNDWTGWCEFFLTALNQQAQSNQKKALGILELYRQKKEWIAELTHSHYAVRALDWFFSRPIFKASDFLATAGIPKPTASRILRLTRDQGFLRQLRAPSGRRPAIMAFPELLNIAEGKKVF